MASSDPASWPALAEMDPDFKKYLETAPPGPPPPSDPSQIPHMRAMMKQMNDKMPYQQMIDWNGVTHESITIPARDGYNIPAVVYKPSSPKNGPLAVILHGGGFVVGMPEQEAPAAVSLVHGQDATVVSVDYRLAPEHVFPKAIEDSWDALKWAAANASSLGADPSKGFLLGGSSAGGNIATVLSHLARDEKLSPPLSAVWLNYPLVFAHEAVPEHLQKDYQAFEQNANAPGILNKEGILRIHSTYKPDPKSPLMSPLLWPTGHKDLPKTVITACGLDPLRDDALIYERELRNAGVKTQLYVYQGMPHAFDAMLAQLPQGQKFREDRAKAYKWLLEGSSTHPQI